MLERFSSGSTAVGMKQSVSRIKVIVLSRNLAQYPLHVIITLEPVEKLKYLGVWFTSDG